jgi:hypothetical protein
MRSCPYCGHANREGIFFCDECGYGLAGTPVEATHSTRQLDAVTASQIPAVKTGFPTSSVDEVSSLIIHVRDVAEPIIVQLADEISFGRMDESSPHQIDVDLTPYGGLDKGVSRLHATINRSDDVLTLHDVESANGTFLNNQRLAKNQPSILRDGDEIRFGKLITHIYFK